jgi:hypothetical protein
MRTTISVPDDVFEKAERLAERTDKSRSQLYTEAMREHLARHDPGSVTERLNEVVDELSPGEDPLVDGTSRSARTEPRPVGRAKGKFTVPDELFEPLPEDLVAAFEGRGE